MAPDHPFPDDVPDFDDMSEVTVRISLPRTGPKRKDAVPTLRVVAGRDMLQFVTISPDEKIIIGRDERANLRLNDITVSKRHARVLNDGEGNITVVDLNSTNGTAVNGKPVTRATLREGDQLEIGAVSLRLDKLSLEELGHLGRVLQRLESANRDQLTRLLTRRFIDEDLPPLGERCLRAGVVFSCAFVDVDKFKNINDTFGHQVGDDVLATVARIIMLGVRDADPCVRFGGEEIVLFLPGTDETSAVEVSDRIRKAIATHDWERTATDLKVTASFGVSQRQPGEELSDWLGRADKAMYAAKEAGRNRVQRSSILKS